MAETPDRDGSAARERRSPVDRICRLIAAVGLFGMMALTFVSVVARYFLNRPIPGDSELQALLLGFIVFAAIPLVTRAQRHIAVRSFAALLTGRALLAQRIVVLAATALGLGFMDYFIYLQAETLAEEGSRTAYLEIPEAPFIYVFAVLMGVAALAAIERLVALSRTGRADDDMAAEIASTE